MPAGHLSVLDGNAVTRERMIGVLSGVLPCLRERDQVILTFSGAATSYAKWRAGTPEKLIEAICTLDRPQSADVDAFCRSSAGQIEADFARLIGRRNEHVLFTSDARVRPVARRIAARRRGHGAARRQS